MSRIRDYLLSDFKNTLDWVNNTIDGQSYLESYENWLCTSLVLSKDVESLAYIFKKKSVQFYEAKLLQHIFKNFRKDLDSFLDEEIVNNYILQFLNSKQLQPDGTYIIPEEEILNFNRFINSHFIPDFVQGIKLDDNIKENIYENYKEGKVSATDETFRLLGKSKNKILNDYVFKGRMPIEFDSKDEELLLAIEQDFFYWMGKTYDTAMADRINDLAYKIINGDLGDISYEEAFKNEFGSMFSNVSRNYFSIVSSSVINTSRNIANIKTYNEYDMREYEFIAILDMRTTEICTSMAGRTFSTKVAIATITEMYAATTKEAMMDAKPYLSWDSDKSAAYYVDSSNETHYLPTGRSVSDNEEIAKMGCSFPPLHYLCRSTIAISQSVVTEIVNGLYDFIVSKFLKICLSNN